MSFFIKHKFQKARQRFSFLGLKLGNKWYTWQVRPKEPVREPRARRGRRGRTTLETNYQRIKYNLAWLPYSQAVSSRACLYYFFFTRLFLLLDHSRSNSATFNWTLVRATDDSMPRLDYTRHNYHKIHITVFGMISKHIYIYQMRRWSEIDSLIERDCAQK